MQILRSAIAKTAHRVQDLVRDVEALRRSAAEADASARRSRAEAQELEEAAAALSSDAAAQLATKVALAQVGAPLPNPFPAPLPSGPYPRGRCRDSRLCALRTGHSACSAAGSPKARVVARLSACLMA